jgi:hypothetical protein
VGGTPRPPCKGSRCKPATVACFGAKATKATKATCTTFLAGLTKELATLQRRAAAATGKKKAALKTEIAAVKQVIVYGRAGLKTLTR